MNKIMILAAVAAISLAGFAGEHDTPETRGEYVQLVAGEKVYAGMIVGQTGKLTIYIKNTNIS